MKEILRRFFHTAPYPLLNIGIESLQKQICANDGILAPLHTALMSMLKTLNPKPLMSMLKRVGGAGFPPSAVARPHKP